MSELRLLPIGECPHAEMTRVLKTKPVRMASASCGAITLWKHDPLHDVVKPMADHVIMAFPAGPVRFERRNGKEFVNGMTRPGTVTVIPAGSSSRWDIYQPLMSFSSTFRPQRSSGLPAKPTCRLLAILWSERPIPTPFHPDCS
jgi:hypothetical protein